MDFISVDYSNNSLILKYFIRLIYKIKSVLRHLEFLLKKAETRCISIYTVSIASHINLIFKLKF